VRGREVVGSGECAGHRLFIFKACGIFKVRFTFLRRVSLFLSVALWSDRIMAFWQVGEFVGRRCTAALAEKLEKP